MYDSNQMYMQSVGFHGRFDEENVEKISVNIAKTSLGEDSFLPTSNRKANLRGES